MVSTGNLAAVDLLTMRPRHVSGAQSRTQLIDGIYGFSSQIETCANEQDARHEYCCALDVSGKVLGGLLQQRHHCNEWSLQAQFPDCHPR
eukprot:529733-Amphidinium_carterae.1